MIDFLARSQKVSILNGIKCDHSSEQGLNEHLSFPKHHQHKRDKHLSSMQMLDDVEHLDIEKTNSDAYNEALDLTERLELKGVP